MIDTCLHDEWGIEKNFIIMINNASSNDMNIHILEGRSFSWGNAECVLDGRHFYWRWCAYQFDHL